MKEPLRANQAPKRIKRITFGVMSAREMSELSEVEIVNRELYDSVGNTSVPTSHGVLDRRLGMSVKKARCDTCGLELAECAGHFGHIRLVLPVFHIGYFKNTVNILQSICKTCSSVLLSESEKAAYLKRLRQPGLDSTHRQGILKSIHAQCRKVIYCPYCHGINGNLRKVPPLKIVHEKYRVKKTENYANAFRKPLETALLSSGLTGDLRSLVGKAQDDINPLRCLSLFECISDEDCIFLGMNNLAIRPEWLLWRYLLVPPSCIRPSVEQEGGSNEDDLTVKLTDIVYTNMIIGEALSRGAPINSLMGDWDYLQLQCAMYINSAMPGVPPSMQATSRPIRGFVQRLNGKQGRFRGNLSGKRVDFSGRTVISPDPNLAIGQVGIPVDVAKMLTFPERVTSWNLSYLKSLVRRGNDAHPGALFVQQGDFGFKKQLLRAAQREKIASNLKIGDIVERHLADNDVVLFNRQPSLHKLSIMAHRAKVMPWKTFRFNECVCAPFNADFDGDEMNIHFPQTEEAKAEATILMGVPQNLVTPRNGQPVIAATQDFITASYLLSDRDVFLNREEACQLVVAMYDGLVPFELPTPALLKPVARWTGKQILSLLLKPYPGHSCCINVELKGRNYSKPNNPILPPEFCSQESWLIVRNSEILAGRLDKNSVGDGSKNSLFYILLRDYGPKSAADGLLCLSKVTSRWISTRGFSIGIGDVTPNSRLKLRKENLVQVGYAACAEAISLFDKGLLPRLAGCDAAQSLESSLSGILNKIREDVGSLCIDELCRHNSPLIMQACGSKGSKINVSQMVGCVGQQIVNGHRIPDGFPGRSLPHFSVIADKPLPLSVDARSPSARGFVRESFYSGLCPTEFFFHAMGGREGLIDTAVKTAETGYMQRRLMKALEDLAVQYDSSVRNASGTIVQFRYGADGLDPSEMEGDDSPVAFSRHILHASCSVDDKIESLHELQNIPLTSSLLQSILSESLMDQNYIATVSSGYLASLRAYSEKYALNRLSNVGQMYHFLRRCQKQVQRAQIEPGTAVGAIGAQSIGEPGTQMTLKTFHFAGVASMNVTLGVPRIKEIINAAKYITTPIITVRLLSENSTDMAHLVKGRLERIFLSDISVSLEELHDGNTSSLKLLIDLQAISKLQLEISANSIRLALLKSSSKLKLKESDVAIAGPDVLFITPNQSLGQLQILQTQHTSSNLPVYDGKEANSGPLGITTRSTLSHANATTNYLHIQRLKRLLPNVLVHGIASTQRAVIHDNRNGSYVLYVEGVSPLSRYSGSSGNNNSNMGFYQSTNVGKTNGFLQALATPGVDYTRTMSNHVMDVVRVLGIEAARDTIIQQIQDTMSSHGMTIDTRHVMLLADTMTYRGEVLGITRFGISKMKDSVLMLASFEQTAEHLFTGAFSGKQDPIQGVSECIILGIPMPIGTGLFKILQKIPPSDCHWPLNPNPLVCLPSTNSSSIPSVSSLSNVKFPLSSTFSPIRSNNFQRTSSFTSYFTPKDLLFDLPIFHPPL